MVPSLLPSRKKARMRVIKIRGLSLDTLTPALSLTGRGSFCDTLTGEREKLYSG